MATRKRRWVVTINNPSEDEIMMINGNGSKGVVHAIFANEIGESETPHIQGYISFKNARTLTGVKKWLGTNRAHLEICRGTAFEAWTYCEKEGDVFRTIGDRPEEEELGSWEQINLMIQEGHSNIEIIQKFPAIAMRCQTAIDKYRLEWDRLHAEWRDVEVVYITGPTGCGKTRSVMDKYGYPNVYRATNGKHPFDTYTGQDVLVFEEFRSSQKIEDMLNWLDGYPIELPARYADKLAKFTKIFIISNWRLNEQYKAIQTNHNATWEAFLRRISRVESYWD